MQCPIKECAYKSRQMEKIHRHWDREHPNFCFPSLKPGYSWSTEIPITLRTNDPSLPSTSTPYVPKPSTSKIQEITSNESESDYELDVSV